MWMRQKHWRTWSPHSCEGRGFGWLAECTVNVDMFMQHRDDSLYLSWRWTKHIVSVEAFVSTSIQWSCFSFRRLEVSAEDQFDELQTIWQDISELVSHKIETQDDKELTEQICRIHIPALIRDAADKLEHLPGSMTCFKDWFKDLHNLKLRV